MVKFWEMIHDIIQKIFSIHVSFKPEMFLLNIMVDVKDRKSKYVI